MSGLKVVEGPYYNTEDMDTGSIPGNTKISVVLDVADTPLSETDRDKVCEWTKRWLLRRKRLRGSCSCISDGGRSLEEEEAASEEGEGEFEEDSDGGRARFKRRIWPSW